MARFWMPLPDADFEPTEAAVPWRLLTDAGHEVVIATEGGATPAADPRALGGVLFGRMGACREAKLCYAALAETPAFRRPIAWGDVDPAAYDGLILPGGHAQGMRQYLDSTLLQRKVTEFWKLDRPVGAICHGVLVLARAIDPDTGHSILRDRRTTSLTKMMERSAYMLTFWKLGRYYRTYDAYVEDEVKAALADPSQYARGPRVLKTPDLVTDPDNAFVVEDENYVSARWPGDAWLFGRKLVALVAARSSAHPAITRADSRASAPLQRPERQDSAE